MRTMKSPMRVAEAAKAATEAEAAQEAEEAEACLCRRRRTARRTETFVTPAGLLGMCGSTNLGARGPPPGASSYLPVGTGC